MANDLYLIVEGDGEVEAVPLLIRRILTEMFERFDIEVKKPYNARGRSNILKPDGLERFLNTIRNECQHCAGVLVLLDAEKDYVDRSHELILSLAQRAHKLGLPFTVEVVCAVCEYESWFLASLATIRPKFADLDQNATFKDVPDKKCNAKEWFTGHMPHGRPYKETRDQVRLTYWMDLQMTQGRSESFNLFVSALDRLTGEKKDVHRT